MFRFRLIFSLLALSLLSACASNPQSSSSGAIYYALQADVELRLWAEQCSALSPQLRQEAWKAKTNWWRRNGAFVEGADYGLTREIMVLSGDRDVTGANLALGMTSQIVEESEKEVANILEQSGDQKKLCLTMLGKFNAGDYDLRDNNQFYPTLVNLQRRSEVHGASLHEKAAEVALEKQRKFGRSLYVVEKLVKRSSCPGGAVKVIKADWPNEVYDVNCPDDSYVLVRCEWGNCFIKD
jgi:hypothetical protein